MDRYNVYPSGYLVNVQADIMQPFNTRLLSRCCR